MNEMIERVARALCKEYGIDPDLDGEHIGHPHIPAPCWCYPGLSFVEQARAAIEAMREPLECMVNAADKKSRAVFENLDESLDPYETWQVMVDEALK